MESKIVVTVYNGLEAIFFSLSLLLLVPSMKFNILFFLYLIISQRVFLEGNPYLLAITMVVSLLHSVFDFLAFKNGKIVIFVQGQYLSFTPGCSRINNAN